MKISEFLQGRSVERQAVTRYINRHDEIFKSHVKKVGKELDLDMVAIEALEKAYPLDMPVNVINGVPKESFIKIQNELIMSQKKNRKPARSAFRRSGTNSNSKGAGAAIGR